MATTRPDAARLLDRAVLIFPAFLILGVVVMIWSLHAVTNKVEEHPSVGIFHPGEYATMNGLSGTVTLEIVPGKIDERWELTLRLMDQNAEPVREAKVYAHGVVNQRYLQLYPLTPGPDPGTWTGALLFFDAPDSVMVHADLAATKDEDWVAEWSPKGGTKE